MQAGTGIAELIALEMSKQVCPWKETISLCFDFWLVLLCQKFQPPL